jgi:hypothetical protein
MIHVFSKCVHAYFAYFGLEVHLMQKQLNCSQANHTTDVLLHNLKVFLVLHEIFTVFKMYQIRVVSISMMCYFFVQ